MGHYQLLLQQWHLINMFAKNATSQVSLLLKKAYTATYAIVLNLLLHRHTFEGRLLLLSKLLLCTLKANGFKCLFGCQKSNFLIFDESSNLKCLLLSASKVHFGGQYIF
jgi:hypothetical protein